MIVRIEDRKLPHVEYVALAIYLGVFLLYAVMHGRAARLPGQRRTQQVRSRVLAGTGLLFVVTAVLSLLQLTEGMLWVLALGSVGLIGIWVVARTIDAREVRAAQRRDLALGYPTEPHSVSLTGTFMRSLFAGSLLFSIGVAAAFSGLAIAGVNAPVESVVPAMYVGVVLILIFAGQQTLWRWWRSHTAIEDWSVLVRGIGAREEARYADGFRAGQAAALKGDR